MLKMKPMDIETSTTVAENKKSRLKRKPARGGSTVKFSWGKPLISIKRYFRSQTNVLTFIAVVGCVIIFVVHLMPFFTYEVRQDIPARASENNIVSDHQSSLSSPRQPNAVDHQKTPTSDYYYTAKQSEFDMDVDFDKFLDDWMMFDDYDLYDYLDDEYTDEYNTFMKSKYGNEYTLDNENDQYDYTTKSKVSSPPGNDNDQTPNEHEQAVHGVEEYKQYANTPEESTIGRGSGGLRKKGGTLITFDGSPSSSFNSDPEETESDSETKGDRDADIMFRTHEMEAALKNITESDILRDTTTPQGKAFDWIVRLDSRELSPSDSLAQERYIMAVLYYSLMGENWFKAKNVWLSENDVCEWNDQNFIGSGVTVGVFECDFDGYITHLQLSDNNLYGRLPPELGFLTRLEKLDLEKNKIEGTIPTQLGNLAKLETLALQSNKVTGSIPTELGRLHLLEQLTLQFNELEGTMPLGICALRPDATDGGFLYQLAADCDPKGDVRCDCCSKCCDGWAFCRVTTGSYDTLPPGTTGDSTLQQSTSFGDDTYFDDYDIEAMMLADEAEDYFDNYGY